MPKTHILVIEDNEESRTMYGIMLRSWGYEVTEASNGRDGVRLAQRRPPDAILLDVMMPELDGFEVCKLLRSDPRFLSIPIVFLTALDTVTERIKGYVTGGDDFITKGQADYQELGVRIQAALDRARRLQSVSQASAPGITVGMMSLRGGVGVSTLALHLAQQAAIQGEAPTMLIDMAYPVGSTGLWSGVTGSRNTITLLSRKPAAINLALIESFSMPNVSGFSFVPGPVEVADTGDVRAESAERMLQVLQEAGYFTVLDLGRAALPLQWRIPQLCDWLVVVTTADNTAQTLATAAMESLPQCGVRASGMLLVFNDITAARPADLGAGLPRVPDLYVPYTRDFQESPETSPLSRLWSMVSAKAAQAAL